MQLSCKSDDLQRAAKKEKLFTCGIQQIIQPEDGIKCWYTKKQVLEILCYLKDVTKNLTVSSHLYVISKMGNAQRGKSILVVDRARGENWWIIAKWLRIPFGGHKSILKLGSKIVVQLYEYIRHYWIIK